MFNKEIFDALAGDEIVVGPFIFVKEEGSGMTVNTEDECLGYCEGVWDLVWIAFKEAVHHNS